jgi:hypothetical protein
MKFAASVTLIVLLLGMPLGCILAGSTPSHPCCPPTKTSVKCPYDALDTAKIVSVAVITVMPVAAVMAIIPPGPTVTRDLLPEIAEDQPDLYVLNPILRI